MSQIMTALPIVHYRSGPAQVPDPVLIVARAAGVAVTWLKKLGQEEERHFGRRIAGLNGSACFGTGSCRLYWKSARRRLPVGAR